MSHVAPIEADRRGPRRTPLVRYAGPACPVSWDGHPDWTGAEYVEGIFRTALATDPDVVYLKRGTHPPLVVYAKGLGDLLAGLSPDGAGIFDLNETLETLKERS